MTKKQKILWFLIVLPEALGFIYDKLFRYSANWLENYQNYFKVSFIVISLVSSVWLAFVSKEEGSKNWLIFSILLVLIFLIYLYLALSFINISIG